MKEFKIKKKKKGGAYVVYIKNNRLIYESISKDRFYCVEECLAFLSSYTDYVVYVEDETLGEEKK